MLHKNDFYFANFHSHTVRCQHASGTEEEFIQRAIANAYDCIGFSDHTPWPYKSDFVAFMRMRVDQLDGYVRTVKALKKKYAGRIRVCLGLECEAFPEFYPWLDEIREEKELDYIILGNHYDTNDETGGFYFGRCREKKQLYRYMETTIAGMETGRFVYLAHPDLCLEGYPVFDDAAKQVSREICLAAKRLNMPLEFNILGFNRHSSDNAHGGIGYTNDHFWEVAAETGGIRAIIGADAHSPEELDVLPVYRTMREKFKNAGIEVIEVYDGFIR